MTDNTVIHSNIKNDTQRAQMPFKSRINQYIIETYKFSFSFSYAAIW